MKEISKVKYVVTQWFDISHLNKGDRRRFQKVIKTDPALSKIITSFDRSNYLMTVDIYKPKTEEEIEGCKLANQMVMDEFTSTIKPLFNLNFKSESDTDFNRLYDFPGGTIKIKRTNGNYMFDLITPEKHTRFHDSQALHR